ncbi:MAG: restriction endonuclease subunit S, partial [Lachnospiraceae bacterium]|nr:restriction endonuclease subunit S [Lachnospiraceae bacterium]
MKYNKLRFDEITLNYDKKRIPLSAMERTKRQGAFRYFGAQGVIDYVDDYIFDGKYLLIAEDGENLKSKRQNIAQIVEGKFWVNNHAHIVQCNEMCILEYLAYLINSKDVSGYITGSAQPKLSQANLNAIEFDIPSIKEQQDILSILLPIEQKIRINNEINNNLAA